ncbi:MAG TPA: cytidine deaminase [Actinomycetota bacterium]|nr:cytidine deaminase [Actinomycetota bacterium]
MSERAAAQDGEGAELDDLMARARAARGHAYAPYSRFRVGAAVSTDRGVFSGANVENASYGVSICAERVAASTAVAGGARRIDAVAVTSSASGPASPCGACRQFLYEFGPEMTVAAEGTDGERKVWALSELLVNGFGLSDLESARNGE